MPHKDLDARRAYTQAYYLAHQEQVKANVKAYQLAHPDKVAVGDARYHEKYGARNLARLQAWCLAHPEQVRKHKKAREAVSGKARARAKRWRYRHPAEALHVSKASQARRRAAKTNAPRNDFTTAQWCEMQAAYDHRCVYCGKRHKDHLTKDHITPLSKGGAHTYTNIVPACQRCNAKKWAGPVLQAIQPLLLVLSTAKPYRAREVSL